MPGVAPAMARNLHLRVPRVLQRIFAPCGKLARCRLTFYITTRRTGGSAAPRMENEPWASPKTC